MPGSGTSTEFPRRRWRFIGRMGAYRAEEAERFEQMLHERLRIGQALGVTLVVDWSSGRTGGWSVDPADPLSERWWRSDLMPVYPPTHWQPGGTDPEPHRVRLVGLPSASGEAPFRTGGDPPWTDALGAALRGLPGGTRVRWRLHGLGAGSSPPIFEPPVPVELPRTAGIRSAPPLTSIGRQMADRRDDRRFQGRWKAGVVIEVRGTEELPSSLPPSIAGASRLDGGNGLRFRPPRFWQPFGPPEFSLSTSEVQGLWPTPWSPWATEAAETPGATRYLRLGEDETGRSVRIPVENGNGRHLAVVGETGMGKSTLMVALAQRASGLGTVVLMDPLGETSRDFVGALPKKFGDRLLWISPKDSPVASNALASAGGTVRERERAVDELVEALRRVRAGRFGETPFWGPRVEETARWAIAVALAVPDGTLSDAERVLTDPIGHLPAQLPEPAGAALRAIRDRRRERPEDIEGGRRLLAEANRSEILRRMLSSAGASWSVRDALRPGGITVLSGDAGTFGEPAAQTYLSIQLALLWCSVVARPAAGPVFLFLDEASFFGHESLAQMLRLGRRFGLHVILATQSLAGFSDPVREAIWTNCSEFVLFRGSPAEAREFDRWGTPVSLERLVSLPRGMAAVLIEKGRSVEWIRTRPRPAHPAAPERWRSAAENASHLWGVEATPPPEPDGSADETGYPPVEARLVVDALLRQAAAEEARPTGPIRLDAWRRSHGLTESAIRAAGRWLSERGLLRSQRTGDGTVWSVSWGRLRAVIPPDPARGAANPGRPGEEDSPASR